MRLCQLLRPEDPIVVGCDAGSCKEARKSSRALLNLEGMSK
jgi:hypothetical protein